MILKKTIIALVAILLSANLIASEELEQKNNVVEKCDSSYSVCLAKCDEKNGENGESCYDACEVVYEKCLNEAQSN